MKLISSKKVTVYLSLFTALLSILLYGLTYFLPFNLLYLIIFTIITGLLVYFMTKYLVDRFLYSKIRILYKTIHDTQLIDKDLAEKVQNTDALHAVEMEVMEWSENRGSLVSQLKKQEKYRKEFIGNVSHELKTPIFNIQGYVLTLLDGGLEDQSINRMYLERTEKSINRMITIVKDLEVISKLESGELKLCFERFNIVDLINEVLEMQEIRAKKNNIKLVFAQENDSSKFVYADKKEIFQVVNNLLVNSIKYGKNKGTTHIEVMSMDKTFLIEIRDNGIGIEPDNLPRIFERFFRVDKSRSRNMGGSGLGLAIVKHIIDAHNQTINVSSTYGEGASFTFTLDKAK
ncbi:sensor histidine kinase [Labilibaculum sp. A4]|uniref:sensor histidine kinase n=1 Tax=Labilibaculum euxinus TaxID=2686357 RepID=UPI000F61FB8F|nr:ATP-binding protein [Labilibaculum euxinus]MBN2597307.1 sensor histidine kinase [Marinifilaceae bacterium]MDQ1772900.1 ATP-binding protein [Labilibaculum euxinus]MWN78500.1 sensor histidine kinase [Labilibaculum euxinus]